MTVMHLSERPKHKNNMRDETKNKCMPVHKRGRGGGKRETRGSGDQQASSLLIENKGFVNHLFDLFWLQRSAVKSMLVSLVPTVSPSGGLTGRRSYCCIGSLTVLLLFASLQDL